MDIEIVEAAPEDFRAVSACVTKLLLELEPEGSDDIHDMGLTEITHDLLRLSRIGVLMAKHAGDVIGVVTLHECAAIYAGGVFGELSELYVDPAYRGQGVGERLLKAAHGKAKELGWTRLEVGTPSRENHLKTYRFYEKQGYAAIGMRLRRLMT